MLFSCGEFRVLIGGRLQQALELSVSLAVIDSMWVMHSKAKVGEVYVPVSGRAQTSAYHVQEPISSMLGKLAQ